MDINANKLVNSHQITISELDNITSIIEQRDKQINIITVNNDGSETHEIEPSDTINLKINSNKKVTTG